MQNDERVLDQDDHATTSEGQSYSLLRSIMMNDRNVFDKTYSWSKKHLQVRKNDNLFGWKTNVNGYGQSYNTQTMNATDADLDIGLALIMADHKWNSYGLINYAREAKELIPDIYENRVANIEGMKIILPYNSQKWRGIEIINPSYFNPVAYKMFASYDPNHNWNELANDSYEFLNRITNYTGLIPDWIEYNYNSHKFENSPKNTLYGDDNFGYEAFRTYYRVSLDFQLNNSWQAKQVLDKARYFFEHELTRCNKISAVYNRYGHPVVNYEDMTTISSSYFLFKNTNSSYLQKFINDKIMTKINSNNMQFNENDTYYSSTWGWFALADMASIKLTD